MMLKLDALMMDENELKKEADTAEDVSIINCLGQRYLGCARKKGHMLLSGTPGNGLASYLDGARIDVDGNVQDAVADTMNSGLVTIHGSAGDALCYAMRGGRIFVSGNAGYRAGVHMKAYKDKQSLLIIGGTAGSFLGEYLAGGTIIVLGLNKGDDSPLTGFFCGNGMYAGTIYIRSRVKPVNLSDTLTWSVMSEMEKQEELVPLLSDYVKTFSLSLDAVLAGTFARIRADSSKISKQLYAAV